MIIFIAILFVVLVVIYFFLDPETKVLDKSERDNLGGTYIKLSDGITHYKLSGPTDCQVVVLIHGGTVPMWTWSSQINALTDAGFRVLIYDKYGRGYSDRPNVIYNQEFYNRQLIELVDKLKLYQSFDLVGLSLGGGTAANFTAQHPDRVRKLVLISPISNNYKVPRIFQIPIIGEFTARLFGINIIVNRFTSLFEGNPDSVKYRILFEEQTTYKGFQRSLLSMLRNDAVRDYTNSYKILSKQNRTPLLIWGSEDTEITKKMISEIKKLLPKLQFKSVADVGHGIVFQ